MHTPKSVTLEALKVAKDLGADCCVRISEAAGCSSVSAMS